MLQENILAKEFEHISLWSTQIAKTEKGIKNESYYSAVLPGNLYKNRYKDVLALESSRVKLKGSSGIVGSDYINANHIFDGESSRYICCQAPLPHTTADFWLMVWEQKATVIVMLTRLLENGRVKANVYWPEKNYVRYGNIIVELAGQQHTRGVTVRSFNLIMQEKDGSFSCRSITQLHYSEWPDSGTPKSTRCLRRLIRLANYYRDSQAGPMIVHCSAGIGRAGTFIATDIMIRAHSSNSKTEKGCPPRTVMDTVIHLREQRRGMVQTLDQYRFVHQAVTDYLLESSGEESDETMWEVEEDEEVEEFQFEVPPHFDSEIPVPLPVC